MAVSSVPYANFVRLQLALGESAGAVSAASRSAGVPCPPLAVLSTMRDELVAALPNTGDERALSKDFVEKHYEALRLARWPGAEPLAQFLLNRKDFDKACEIFSSPELRVRMDCLILAKQSEPGRIAEILYGWSRFMISETIVNIYAYFFCNVECMSKFNDWMSYIEAFQPDRHRWFMAQAFDTHTKADFAVLLSDLSIRASIELTPEEAVKDLMMAAFVNTKKESRKVDGGVRAKNTDVFEWASVFGAMYDRVMSAESGGDREDVLATIRINLTQAKEAGIKKISELGKISTGAPGE